MAHNSLQICKLEQVPGQLHDVHREIHHAHPPLPLDARVQHGALHVRVLPRRQPPGMLEFGRERRVCRKVPEHELVRPRLEEQPIVALDLQACGGKQHALGDLFIDGQTGPRGAGGAGDVPVEHRTRAVQLYPCMRDTSRRSWPRMMPASRGGKNRGCQNTSPPVWFGTAHTVPVSMYLLGARNMLTATPSSAHSSPIDIHVGLRGAWSVFSLSVSYRLFSDGWLFGSAPAPMAGNDDWKKTMWPPRPAFSQYQIG